MIARYNAEFRQLGRNAIIADFRTYLLVQLGATEATAANVMLYNGAATADPQFNFRTALRAITNDARNAFSTFENLFAPRARDHAFVLNDTTHETINAKDLLAYYWLAARDPNMVIAADDLRTTNTRETLIAGAKANFTREIAEILTTYNPGHPAEEQHMDFPACPNGTYVRLIQSVIYNTCAQIMDFDPALEFPNKARAFIVEKFRILPPAAQDNVYNFIQNSINLDDVTPEQQDAADTFTNRLQRTNIAEFIANCTTEYGAPIMTPAKIAAAHRIFEDQARRFTTGGCQGDSIYEQIQRIVIARRTQVAAQHRMQPSQLTATSNSSTSADRIAIARTTALNTLHSNYTSSISTDGSNIDGTHPSSNPSMTYLNYYISYSDANAVQLLIDAGASVTAADNRGVTPRRDMLRTIGEPVRTRISQILQLT